jgi:hypothetical protein
MVHIEFQIIIALTASSIPPLVELTRDALYDFCGMI